MLKEPAPLAPISLGFGAAALGACRAGELFFFAGGDLSLGDFSFSLAGGECRTPDDKKKS